MANVSNNNLFGTIVHDISVNNAAVETLFGTVVHNIPVNNTAVETLFSTVVHNTPVNNAAVETLFGTCIHDSGSTIFNVSDITGIVDLTASFDSSTQGWSTSSYAHQWSWVSVPVGSALANQSLPLPDNNATTPINMTNNEGLWHFEGDADDSSGNGRNGTVTGATQVAGRIGSNAYQFGNTDYIEFGLASNFVSSDFSIAFWIKGDGAWTPAIWDAVIGASNAFTWSTGFGIFWQDSTTLRCFVGGYNVTFADITISSFSSWNHIVMTYDGANITTYLNGAQASQVAYSLALTGLTNLFQVSKLGTHLGFEGTIDEVAIWSRAISTSEISNAYFLQSGSAASGSGANVNLDDSFSFVPEVTGTYEMNLNFIQYINNLSLSGNVTAEISSAGPGPTPVITGSNPTVKLVETTSNGYVLNTYSNSLLSVQRSRTVEQVPFRIGTKGKQSLRIRTNQEFTGSS